MCDVAVGVESSTLVLAVVFQGDGVEVKPAVMAFQLAARLLQASVFLSPLN